MTEIYEMCASILTYFDHEFYRNGIKDIRRDLSHYKFHESWVLVIDAIRQRRFAVGEPLHLIHQYANQSLDENTDEEAYKWLNIMIENIERTDGLIVEPYACSIILLSQNSQKPLTS
jgi:hypothetical protein